jgi:acetylornithine deacetylase/succinyl-diaminopimelate desuccinylase-like protein
MTDSESDIGTGEGPPGVAARIDADETISLLQELVQIETPYFREEEGVEFVYEWLTAEGLEPEFHHVSEPELTGFEGRNVLVHLEGEDSSAPTLLVNAHVDTVELVDGWTEDPLSGRVDSGRLYGQGAADMKAGLAAAMMAVRAVANSDVGLAGDLLFSVVVDEEGPYGLGTDQLIRDGLLEDCDMAVVPEPGPVLARGDVTNPALFLGARGRFLYDIAVEGEAAHASTPTKGTNAVVDAGRVAGALSAMETGSHPRLGRGSVCPLKIEGGSETLSVPGECRLVVDRHVVPGERQASVVAEAQAVADSLELASSVSVSLRPTPHEGARYGPYVVDESEPVVRGLQAATTAVTGESPALGYFESVGDFNYLCHRAGIPTVVLGPTGGNIHSTGEWVDTAETVSVARILAAGVAELLT